MRKVYTDEHIDYLKEISLGKNNREITKLFNAKFDMDKGESAIRNLRNKHRIKCANNGLVQMYKEKHIDYLRKIAPDRTNEEITELFNKKFNMNKSPGAIASIKYKNKISSFDIPKEYTKEEVNYLRKISYGKTNKEITQMFNKKFNSNRNESGIHCVRMKYKIYTGDDGRFQKGNFSPNRVSMGTERITKDGYIQVKIRDGKQQRNWRGKHILEWEKVNGSLPEGHAIIFGDGNNRNFDINNLICVSRKQLLGLNRHNLIQEDSDLTKTAINIVDLKYKISERKK
ncbi:HNH endonuclease signature motif containing protein [Tissierella creatinophila]|uniref:HNH nuclease domain-containing protein n=1 Tax=Tissierella creatinophila DSM 6911 TaxID=1123403 RepID=A0A1U7M5E0_TISCR|nr:HNH endonuclease signature motif containing protein [Tissierella creatinophila]OLS02408.1 hypothetical protein TICRE_15970 [Tissierella creatinophila DSM 6911]